MFSLSLTWESNKIRFTVSKESTSIASCKGEDPANPGGVGQLCYRALGRLNRDFTWRDFKTLGYPIYKERVAVDIPSPYWQWRTLLRPF
jgi:hypothetical protein